MNETSITDKPQIAYSECYNLPFVKVCSKCKNEKALENYSVYKYKPKKDGTQKIGLRTYCNSCKNEYTKKFFLENEGYKKQWRLKNPDKVKNENLKSKPRTDKWRLENKDKIKAKKKQYKQKHIEHIYELNKKYEKRDMELLTDRYVISQIIKRSTLKVENIKHNKELIEVKRLIIKTKRL